MRNRIVAAAVVALLTVAGTSQAQVAQPPGTVAVGFSVDDSANKVYQQGDLKWKGSFVVDLNGVAKFDPTWSGAAPGKPPLSGWPTLWDDGPWTNGGHEPIGAKAHDHVWGVVVFVVPPALGTDTYEYGLIDASYETTFGNGWMWQGPNGVFAVDAAATADVEAAGMAFQRFGKTDLMFILDATKLAAGSAWNTSTVTVKSSIWGWGELTMTQVAGGMYALDLAPVVGGGNALLPHTGLLNSGDTAEFVFVLGGFEYFADGHALSDGVTVQVSAHGHRFVSVPIQVSATSLNTFIIVP